MITSLRIFSRSHLPAFLAFFALVSPAAPAAETPLRWEEMMEWARTRNPDLAGAALSWESSRNATREAYGGFLPKAELNASQSSIKTEAANLTTQKTNLQYGATATLNLFRGFGTLASVAKARATEEEARAGRDLTSANLRHDLRLAYFNAYVLQQRVSLNERTVKREERNQKLIELKYNSGSEARWNVLTAKADLARARYNLENARSQLRSAREQLARLLYLESLPESRPLADPDPSLFRLPAFSEAETVRAHPELVKSRHAEDRLAGDRSLARSAFYPAVDLSLAKTWDRTRPEGGITAKTEIRTLALTATWNVFNGLVDFHKLQEASLGHEAAALQSAGAERKLLANLRQRAAEFEQSLAQIPVARAIREAAEERSRTVSEQYRAGLKGYLDWEQSETALLSAENGEVQALATSLNACAELELALGRTLEQP